MVSPYVLRERVCLCISIQIETGSFKTSQASLIDHLLFFTPTPLAHIHSPCKHYSLICSAHMLGNSNTNVCVCVCVCLPVGGGYEGQIHAHTLIGRDRDRKREREKMPSHKGMQHSIITASSALSSEGVGQ